MSLKDLKIQIKKNEFSRLFYFYGEEKYLIKAYLKIVTDKLLPSPDEFSFMEIEGKALGDFSSAIAFKESFPFLTDKKILLIKDFNINNITKEQKENLSLLLKDIPDYIYIFFISASKTEDKKDKIKSFCKLIETAGGLCCEFVYASDADLITWIKRHAKSQQKNIETDVCQYLIQTVGGDMSVLENEIQKLCHISGTVEITKKNIDSVCIKCLDAKTYELTDALLKKNYSLSFIILNELYEMRTPDLIIASSIYKCFCDMYITKLMEQNGNTAEEIAKKTGLMLFLAKKYIQVCKTFSLNTIRTILKICSDTERSKKRGRGEDKIKLEKMIGEIIIAQKGR